MRVVTIATMCALVTLALAPQAEAFCPETFGPLEQASWKVDIVKYRISDTAPEDVKSAIEAAVTSWASVACTTLRFEDAGVFELDSISFQKPDGGAQIYFFWYDEAHKGSFPTDAANLFFPSRGHDGIDALNFSAIAINAFYKNESAGYRYEWATDGASSKYDVQALTTRMIGQSIGLTYSNAPDSVMKQAITAGDTSGRTLGADDIAALQYLYGAAGGDDCPADRPQPDPTCADGGNTGDPPATEAPPSDPPADDGGTEPGNQQPADDKGGKGGNGNGGDGSGAANGSDNASSGDDSGKTNGGGESNNAGVGVSGCATDGQCGADEICNINGACVPLKKSGGCALTPPSPGGGTDSQPAAAMLVLTLLGAGLARRRRR